MDLNQLQKANEIADKIRELDMFIRQSELRWTGTLINKARGIIFKANAAGYLGSEEIHLETDIKNKMLDILREEIKILEQELSNI